MNEAELITHAQNGDRDAFSSLLEMHYDMIYRAAYKWCGDAHQAEDIAQDVCIKVGRSMGQFRGESKFSTWLYRITINMAHDARRKHKPHVDMLVLETLAGAHAADVQRPLEHQQLWQKVQTLPDKQRSAILLVYSEEMSHGEAAEIMNCKESTVSWHIHQAKKTLGDWATKEYGGTR